jgi:hypothetical protein
MTCSIILIEIERQRDNGHWSIPFERRSRFLKFFALHACFTRYWSVNSSEDMKSVRVYSRWKIHKLIARDLPCHRILSHEPKDERARALTRSTCIQPILLEHEQRRSRDHFHCLEFLAAQFRLHGNIYGWISLRWSFSLILNPLLMLLFAYGFLYCYIADCRFLFLSRSYISCTSIAISDSYPNNRISYVIFSERPRQLSFQLKNKSGCPFIYLSIYNDTVHWCSLRHEVHVPSPNHLRELGDLQASYLPSSQTVLQHFTLM